MKNIAIVVLAVLLAAGVIIGSVVYREHLKERDAIKDELSRKDSMVRELQGKIEVLQSEAESRVKQLQTNCEGLVSGLRTQLLSRDAAVRELQERIQNLQSQADTKAKQLETKCEGIVSGLRTQLLSRDAAVRELQERIQNLQSQADTKAKQLETKCEGIVSGLRTQLLSRDAMLREFKGKIGTERNERDGLQRQLAVVKGEKDQLKSTIGVLQSAHDAVASQLRSQIRDREVTIGQLEEKLSITFVDRILFEFGKAAITPQGKEVLTKVGEVLKHVQAKQIRVVGHTDNIPIRERYRYRFPSNWELSAARASAVVRYFQEQVGLEPTNLEAVGRSFYEPVASNETFEGRAHNRRVSIIITPKIAQD